MTQRSAGFVLAVIVTAAIAIAIVVVPVVVVSQRQEQAVPTPAPTVVALARNLETLPKASSARRKIVAADLSKFLSKLYERAFLTVGPAAEPSPSPPVVHNPTEKIADLFTKAAGAELRSDPDVFRTIDDIEFAQGQISYAGVATLEGSKAVQALLEIDFSASGHPTGRTVPVVKMRQVGSLLLVRSGGRWFVDGFDLDFRSRPGIPSPIPSPA